MSFCIESVAINGKWNELCNPYKSLHEENIFTLIVGQNATGKSRLLRKIVSNYIFEKNSKQNFEENEYSLWSKYPNHEQSGIRTSSLSQIHPSNVIAVSTGKYDRFPSQTSSAERSYCPYTYIGHSTKNQTSPISSSLASILEGLYTQDNKFYSLAYIFDYLEFLPYLEVKLTLSLPARKYISELREASQQVRSSSDIIETNHRSFSHRRISNFTAEAVYRFFENERKVSTSIEIDLQNPYWLPKRIDMDLIVYLLQEGSLSISDITLIEKKTKKSLRLSQASSGQQCMLTMILGIAGSIENDSLICIDEPEISLHPKWQSDIVKQIQSAFSDYRGCHFIIATHSPQIVSGLTSSNGFVLNIEEMQLYESSEYAKRSADYQLAEIFGAPGSNNEYLIRLALTILTKISRREELSRSDLEKIDHLEKIKEALSENDPVLHLIEQIEALR